MSGFILRGQRFTCPKVQPGLYVAATPIGNLSDITLRVLDVLAGCDLIACEDTRVSSKLLKHYGITTRKISYHDHNEEVSGPKLIDKLKDGSSICLISDAGTPLVSDPGFKLVNACREEDIPVFALPGASSPLAALVSSGLPSDRWSFQGFLPSKSGARQTLLEANAHLPGTVIYFESPKRLSKSLADMLRLYGPQRLVCVAREITKLHEDVVVGSLASLSERFETRSVKGEIVILVSPPQEAVERDLDELLLELLKSHPVSKAAAEAAQLTGQSKRELYQRALRLKDEDY